MKLEIDRIRTQIENDVARVRAADNAAAQQEQEIREKYDAAILKKSAALDSGDMDAYRAAGLEAESRRLDMEFIEETKKAEQKPAATVEEKSRIRSVVRAEFRRIRAEGLDRMKKRFSDAENDCAEILRQLSALDKLFVTWESVVMREKDPEPIILDTDRLMFSQMENAARAQVSRFEYFDTLR